MASNGLLIGGPVWGDVYADIFEHYCVASMRSPANLAALRANGASLEIYTDVPTWDRVNGILARCGIEYEVKPIPHCEGDSKYDTLAKVHSWQVRDCAAAGRPFHMLVCDQVYSQNYFPRMFKLAAKHGDLIHTGVNCAYDGSRAEIDAYRNEDGSISIPSDALGAIAWKHRGMRQAQFLMNDGEWPDIHFHMWRARDRAMIFCAHNSPIYLTPETGGRLGNTRSTLDSMAHLIGDYHAPTLRDDMTLTGLEVVEVGPRERVTWPDFALATWRQAKTFKSLNRYYKRPSAVVSIPVDECAPPAAKIMRRQRRIAERLIAHGAEQGWPPCP